MKQHNARIFDYHMSGSIVLYSFLKDIFPLEGQVGKHTEISFQFSLKCVKRDPEFVSKVVIFI
jgi:hypothetical protein